MIGSLISDMKLKVILYLTQEKKTKSLFPNYFHISPGKV